MPEDTSNPLEDPFDPERLRATSFDDIAIERVTLVVPVRRPARGEFFRVNASADYSVDWWVLERNDDLDRQTYWVTERYRAELLDDLRRVRVFTCVNKRGTVYLWPCKLPTDNTSSRHWAESALRVAEDAKHVWVKMAGNRDLGAYELFKAQGDLGEPIWPDKSFSDLLRLAFDNGRLIDSLDHPVLRELRGEF
jgi:hypothetical protein